MQLLHQSLLLDGQIFTAELLYSGQSDQVSVNQGQDYLGEEVENHLRIIVLRELHCLIFLVNLEDTAALEVLDPLDDDLRVHVELLNRLVLEEISIGGCDPHKRSQLERLPQTIFVLRHGSINEGSEAAFE